MAGKRTAAVLMAILILIIVPMISADAITVTIDSKDYTLNSPTPTIGSFNVLLIRVGFTDYSLDDEEYPAKSEEELLSYFDDSEDSVSTFYRNSSYNKLNLKCDNIYNYTAKHERDYYDGGSKVSDELLEETLTALKDEVNYKEYDGDGDSSLDFVCLHYSGPGGNFGSSWWSYVIQSSKVEVDGMKAPVYTFIHGDAETYTHEFGHILGVPDYYSTIDGSTNSIGTYDIMSYKDGDHNGFSKWAYGWLSDDDICFVDKGKGDTVVELAPFETGLGDGKKIAVIAPSFNNETKFLDEYFLIEFDSGAGNNEKVFKEYGLKPGFRIFHVNASDPDVYDITAKADLSKSNDRLRMNLIHNVKNELMDPAYWRFTDIFYREGNELTPVNSPNTGFNTSILYNGKFTGISFTDFVTEGTPSFKVSFSDIKPDPVDYKFSLRPVSLDQKFSVLLESDTPLAMLPKSAENYEAPYMISKDGEKLYLDIASSNDSPLSFNISYNNSYPSIRPDTLYTIVIPEGFFLTGYDQLIDEFRYDVTTDKFFSQTTIEKYKSEAGMRISNVFKVTDNTYGRIELDATTKKCTFNEYNLNGELIDCKLFDAPQFEGSGQKLYGIKAYHLNDGNIAFCINTVFKSYFTKIDRQCNFLSETFAIDDDLPNDYPGGVSGIDFEPFKNGLYKYLESADGTKDNMILTIDFLHDITVSKPIMKGIYYPLGSDLYAIQEFTAKGALIHIFDKTDNNICSIPVKGNMIGIFENEGNINILSETTVSIDNDTSTNATLHEIFDISGSKIQSADLSEKKDLFNKYDSFNRTVVTDTGYYLIKTDMYSKESTVMACDRQWNKLGELKFDKNTRLEFLGECGLSVRSQYLREIDDEISIVSRFNIGDFEIINRPESTEESTQAETSATDETSPSSSPQKSKATDSNVSSSSENNSSSAISAGTAVKTGETLPAALLLCVLSLSLTVLMFIKKKGKDR